MKTSHHLEWSVLYTAVTIQKFSLINRFCMKMHLQFVNGYTIVVFWKTKLPPGQQITVSGIYLKKGKCEEEIIDWNDSNQLIISTVPFVKIYSINPFSFFVFLPCNIELENFHPTCLIRHDSYGPGSFYFLHTCKVKKERKTLTVYIIPHQVIPKDSLYLTKMQSL